MGARLAHHPAVQVVAAIGRSAVQPASSRSDVGAILARLVNVGREHVTADSYSIGRKKCVVTCEATRLPILSP